MSQQMAGLMGSSGTVANTTAADTSMGTAGPVVPQGAARTGASGILGGLSRLTDISRMFGNSQEEREKNAKTFAALVKDVGSAVQDMSESTLMQRMMEHSMSGPSFLDTGASPSGGVAAIPRTFDPSLASHIVNQMGYK